MKIKVWISIFVLLFFVLSLGVGCSYGKSETVELTVSAAASLTDAMNEIKEAYTRENTWVEIALNFGSSGALQQQIEQGAPCDIFISAAPGQMNALQDQELLLNDTRRDLLENKIVLVMPKGVETISSFEEIAGDKVEMFSIGAPDSVPAGRYAREVLVSLNIWDVVESKLVLARDVRQVLAYVETGNVDAGIVYQTDAKISDKVQIVVVAPEGTHSPIVYPVAVLKSSKHKDEAIEFIEYLFSDEVKTIFQKYGFTVIN